MPSDKDLYLWWSGSTDSVFLYYLTGAMAISFFATILITKSLRREESRVIELLHMDNGRDILVTYLLKVTTSIMPGSSCPKSLKVFMQLKGERDTSEFFQLRAKSCGKEIFQRGHTDIFIATVPDRLGYIKSVELLVSGLEGNLLWKIKDVELYNPVNRSKKYLPVTMTTLEVLSQKVDNALTPLTNSWTCWIIRNLFKYHQWMAMFGNTVRLGAFTELVHVLCVFTSLFSVMILSQMFYISLPRGEFRPSPEEDLEELEEGEEDPGMFNLNNHSLLIATAASSMCCSVLILALELLLRSVKSEEENPGNAYHKMCGNESLKFQNLKSQVKTNTYSYSYNAPVFFLPQCDYLDVHSVDIKHGSKLDNTDTDNIPEYLPLFVKYLTKELEQQGSQSNSDLYKDSQQNGMAGPEFTGETFELEKTPTISSKFPNLPNWKRKTTEQKFEREDSDNKLHEIELFHPSSDEEFVSSLDLDQLMSSTNNVEQGLIDWSYLDDINTGTTSQIFENVENDSCLEQVVIEMPEQNDSILQLLLYNNSEESSVTEDIAGNGTVEHTQTVGSDSLLENANESKNALVVELKESENLVDVVSSDNIDREQPEVDLRSSISKTWNEECILSIQKSSNPQIIHDWEYLLKTWSRQLVKDLCDIIKNVREKLILEELDVGMITLMLLNKCQHVLQRLVIACYMQSSQQLYEVLGTDEASKLMTHLSIEIMVTAMEEIFVMLMKTGNANLVDLILRSHRIMQMLQYSAMVVVYVLSNQQNVLELLRYLILANDMHHLLTVVLHGCFDLVTTYNLVAWRSLKVLIEREVKDHLETSCYVELQQYIQHNIQNETTLDTAVSRLCIAAEEHGKEELWEDLHNERKIFTNVLIKCQILRTLNRKISKLKKRKEKFDLHYDLLPKEPKSRLQRLAEKRLKTMEYTQDVVQKTVQERLKNSFDKFAKHVSNMNENCKIDETKPEKLSKEVGQVIENLSSVRDRLKVAIGKQGLTKMLDGALLLAQASLHPGVIVQGDSDGVNATNVSYKFDNFLQFKRAEATLTNFFQVTASELIKFLLKTAASQHNLKCVSDKEINHIVFDVLVKLDTMVDLFYEDLDNVMRQCIRTEQRLEKQKTNQIIINVAKKSVLSLVNKASLSHWSDIDLSNITASEMSALAFELDEFDETELHDIIHFLDGEQVKGDGDVSQNAAVQTPDATAVSDNNLINIDEAEVDALADTGEESNEDVIDVQPDAASVEPNGVEIGVLPEETEFDNVPIDIEGVVVNILPDTPSVESKEEAEDVLPGPTSLESKQEAVDVLPGIASVEFKDPKLTDDDQVDNRTEKNDVCVHTQTGTDSIQEIIKDLMPVKTSLELLTQKEAVRSYVTMVRYINKSKLDREHLCTVQLNNIIDGYYMIGEGDDSHTLTSAGLHQLEHDCTNEVRKPLPAWVKVITLMFMIVLLILITVYVTVIGGQFSTTDLQEWMCYYLLSVLVFGLILEPVRACIVGCYTTRIEHRADCNTADHNQTYQHVLV